MWFAGFQTYQHNPWLVHLAAKMLVNDPIVDSLLLKNPFKGNLLEPDITSIILPKYGVKKQIKANGGQENI